MRKPAFKVSKRLRSIDEAVFGRKQTKPTRKKIPKHKKDLVWAKYIGVDKAYGKCYVCKKVIHTTTFEVAHNKAVAKGGSDKISNLRAICRGCNLAMGTMSIEAFKRNHFPENKAKSNTKSPRKTRKTKPKTKHKRKKTPKSPFKKLAKDLDKTLHGRK